MDFEPDGVQPENDIPEDADFGHDLRYKALLLLLVFLIPTLVLVYELLTGAVSGWWMKSVQPHLQQLDAIVIF